MYLGIEVLHLHPVIALLYFTRGPTVAGTWRCSRKAPNWTVVRWTSDLRRGREEPTLSERPLRLPKPLHAPWSVCAWVVVDWTISPEPVTNSTAGRLRISSKPKLGNEVPLDSDMVMIYGSYYVIQASWTKSSASPKISASLCCERG